MLRTLFWSVLGLALAATSGGGPHTIYLPVIIRAEPECQATACQRTVNAPYLNVPDMLADSAMSQYAIFWFGQISPSSNSADVRVAHNDTELIVFVSIYDRQLWYQPNKTAPTDLTAYDSAALYLRLEGNRGVTVPASAYRFTAQPYWQGNDNPANYRQAARGNGGSGWNVAALAFTAAPGFRGSWNNTNDDSGWALIYRIPFSSLGLAGRPANGTVWGLGLQVFDRDDSGATFGPTQNWPEGFAATQPVTWGRVRFGLPTYTPPASTPGGTLLIREGLTGTVVADADVGGTVGNLCGGHPDYDDFWSDWPNANWGSETGLNVQSQSDLSDRNCFARTYLRFPLTLIPAGKVIRSARLVLHQTGGSGTSSNGNPPVPERIQLLRVADSWDETTLTWNNAPLAYENDASALVVGNVTGCGTTLPWPCVRREWEATRVTALAYAAGQALNLALYSADTPYGTGKYFTSSESAIWNAVGRPTLVVEWGNP